MHEIVISDTDVILNCRLVANYTPSGKNKKSKDVK